MGFCKTFTLATARRYTNWTSRSGQIIPSSLGLVSEESLAVFQSYLPNILNEAFSGSQTSLEIANRIKKITEYNINVGNSICGMLTLYAYENLEKPENISDDSLHQIRVLAWLTEMIHPYFAILDDIKTEATTRYGKHCWYLQPEGGNQAINDAGLLRSSLYELLANNFKNKFTLVNIQDLFNKAFFNMAIGQYLDDKISYTNTKNFDHFTMDGYNTIADYKTYCTLKLPIHLALTLANKYDKNAIEYMDNICKDLGRFVQMQKDYHDCYQEDVGTDIQEGKCTWLAIAALQRCTRAQHIVLRACYASDQPAHFERVKVMYDQLHLPQLYKEQEIAISESVVRKTQLLNSESIFPPQFFLRLLDYAKHKSLNC